MVETENILIGIGMVYEYSINLKKIHNYSRPGIFIMGKRRLKMRRRPTYVNRLTFSITNQRLYTAMLVSSIDMK